MTRQLGVIPGAAKNLHLAPFIVALVIAVVFSRVATAQQPPHLIPLDGKAVYVSRNNHWEEAHVFGASSSSDGSPSYTVKYESDAVTEEVPADRVISLADAQRRGIATTVYDLSSPEGIRQMLEAHNAWRHKYGVPPLTWSSQLADFSREWAERLLREKKFYHRPDNSYGENMTTSQGIELSPKNVVQGWGDESKDYSEASGTCISGRMCGHFTQLVWKNTTQVGCGLARAQGRDVWVCDYSPPGNYVGQPAY